MLRVAELVARKQHGRALGQQQRGKQIKAVLAPQREDSGVVGRALAREPDYVAALMDLGGALVETGDAGRVRTCSRTPASEGAEKGAAPVSIA